MPSLSEPAGQGRRAPAELLLQLERVLASPGFSQSVRMQRFLRFIVERTIADDTESLKESIIGVQVFDRKIGYDPKIDSIVRVEARRLRTKLDEYRRDSGASDLVWILLPKGGYVPEFVWRLEAPENAARSEALPALIPPPRKTGRRYALFAVFVLTFCVTAAWLTIPKPFPVSSGIQWKPFTSWPGYETTPAFSPDGETLAFAAGAIYLQRVGSDQAVRLTHSDQPESEPVWSADGAEISFFRQESPGNLGIYSVPAAGGSEHRIAGTRGTLASARMDRSADGRFLVTAERAPSGGVGLLLISVADGTRRWLTDTPDGDDWCPRFSPDGNTLAFARSRAQGVQDLYLMHLRWEPGAGASPQPPVRLTFDNHPVYGHAWSADGRSIVAASKRNGDRAALWRFPISGGQPVQIQGTENQALQPAIARKGGRMAYVSQFTNMAIWRAPVGGQGPPQHLIASTQYDTDPQFSPDGKRIAFRSNRSGTSAIWVADAEGTGAVRAADLNGPLTGPPRWSPDATRLAFDARVGGHSLVRMAYADGGAPSWAVASLPEANDMLPAWSRDGHFLYFASNRSGGWELWKEPPAGGSAIRLTQHGGFNAEESADGTYIYYSKGANIPGVWKLPGEELVMPSASASRFGWTLGRRGIYYVEAGPNEDQPADILYFDFETRSVRQIARTTGKAALGGTCITVSPDEKWIAWAQVDRAGSDIILAAGFH